MPEGCRQLIHFQDGDGHDVATADPREKHAEGSLHFLTVRVPVTVVEIIRSRIMWLPRLPIA